MTEQNFEFEVPAYTQGTVIRLLTNYVEIRSTLVDHMPKPIKPLYTTTAKYFFREKPFGSSSSTPWPFMTKGHAQSRSDGKKKARMTQDLHVCTIDLEEGLKTLTDEEYKLLADYYIFGEGTIQSLAEARGLLSRGRLQEKIQRTIKKLVRIMNEGTYYE